MLALATTRAGAVPLFGHARDGHARDQLSLVAAMEALADQRRADDEEAPLLVAASGVYRAEHGARLTAAGGRWSSRVPDPATAARAALAVADAAWQQEGDVSWATAPQAPAGARCPLRRSRSWPRSGNAGDQSSACGSPRSTACRPLRSWPCTPPFRRTCPSCSSSSPNWMTSCSLSEGRAPSGARRRTCCVA